LPFQSWMSYMSYIKIVAYDVIFFLSKLSMKPYVTTA
jgi:hypothetical protein